MKGLLTAIVTVAVSFGIVAGAVFAMGDDEILAQPPERAAEEFVRAIGLGQLGASRDMLSRDAKRRTSNEEMRRMSHLFRARHGRLDHVKGTVADRRGDTAMVRVRIEGERVNATPLMALVRESGVWSVARAGDVVTPDDSTAQKGPR